MVKVNVKWGKESYEVETAPSIEEFGALLFSLTMVPPERQKLMCKGKMVKDSAAVAALKDGDKLVLMGTADAPPAAPAQAVQFLEDMSDAQKLGVVKDMVSAGLQNLGNTCYMASTLQCLRAVPELKQALISKSAGGAPAAHDPHHAVVRHLGSLYREMDLTVQPVTPMMFTTVFRSTFPQFAETDSEGHWRQQDAEEALGQLMSAMASVLKGAQIASGGGVTGSPAEANTIDALFGGQQETRTHVKGLAPDDPAAELKVTVEPYRRLKCFIDIETNFLFQGLKAGLTEELELRGKLYERTSRLLTLPKYLIVQMMRFGWRNDTKKKSKILRKVDFPLKLDVLDFAHPTLKHQLSQARNLQKEEQDEKLGLAPLNKKAKTEGAASASPEPMADVDAAAAGASAAASSSAASSSAPMTLTTPTSGQYEVFAVVTHKGRDSDSGHYVSWCKQKDGQWLKFDDDKVSRVTEDEVKTLKGGGDFDMAVLLFYRRLDDVVKFAGRTIPQPKPEKEVEKDGKDKGKEKEKAPAAAAASSSSSSSK